MSAIQYSSVCVEDAVGSCCQSCPIHHSRGPAPSPRIVRRISSTAIRAWAVFERRPVMLSPEDQVINDDISFTLTTFDCQWCSLINFDSGWSVNVLGEGDT